jgi:hypothetical protein
MQSAISYYEDHHALLKGFLSDCEKKGLSCRDDKMAGKSGGFLDLFEPFHLSLDVPCGYQMGVNG